MTRLLAILCIIIMMTLEAFADKPGIKVVDCSQDETDMAAAQRNLRDSQGNKCALVRVLIIDDDATITARYVELEKKVNEYALWMPEGSTAFKIRTSAGDSLNIAFRDYGIPKLDGLNVYVVTIESPATQLKKEGMKGMLKLTVVPRTSTVEIDGQAQKLRFGRLSITLSPGTHTISVATPSGKSAIREVQIGKDPVELEINLNQTN